MKIGIDLCSFAKSHAGGKDEVAYNLLRGFALLGYSKEVVCFCYEELAEKIREISADLEICIVPSVELSGKFVSTRVRRCCGLFIRKMIPTYNIGAILFTNKLTPWVKFPVPTIMIPHDIQAFQCGSIPELPRFRGQRLTELFTSVDFFLRDHIIAISDYDKDAMKQYLPWAQRKIKRIYNPIRFENSTRPDAPRKYITALNIQWLHKNAKTLIAAYTKIARDTQFDLILVGNPPPNYDALQLRIKESGIEDRVHFTGFVSQEELDSIITQTRIYVNPSFYEGFGMTAVEMMGKCVPTIVAKTTAMPEVTQGLCRYYEPAEDADALAKVLVEELERPLTDVQLMEIAAKMKEAYDYVNVAKDYWDYIQGTITGKK